jgi:hypothetical protein
LGDFFTLGTLKIIELHKITEPKNLGYFFPSCALILTKMALAAFWTTFSQTHLVTLIAAMYSNTSERRKMIK